ncbi:polysaccharide lyase 8 family protein [Paenibacillus sp. FSL E2-0178]|uniref:polysaccharide lyase 8 family protein n=1 Tax=Paenibacillus sp. FSL E2-0178 TaxID=2921361 RepID=UPI00315841FC
MQILRNKWLQYISGDTLSHESLQSVRHDQDTMLDHQELLWADVPYAENASDVFVIIGRLRGMAIALKSSRSACYLDSTLRQQVIYGLGFLYAQRYNESSRPYGNWWYWEIGVPIALLETLLLMEELLDTELVEQLLLPIDKYVGDPAFHAQWFVAKAPPSTGANLVWKSTAVALAAVIQGDGQKLSAALSALLPVFKNVSEGDGFYEDGSFIQHDKYAYTGGYGVSLLQDVVRLMVWLHDTPWELPGEARDLTAKWIEDTFVPLMYRGSMLDMASGREISRADSQNHECGHSVITSCLRFSRILDEAEQVRLLSRAKGWIVADTYKLYLADAPPDTAAQAGALLDNELVEPAREEAFCKLFAHMDRAVLQGPGFAYSISMFSSRIYSYESINRENLKGWYTSYGMGQLYNSDLGQYADAYWPTVDPCRLPGTTVTNKRQEHGAGQGRLSTKSFVGGAVLHNQYGAIAMELEDVVNEADGLTALKSWFLFGNRIVALGSDIKSLNSARVETVIDNRKLKSLGDHAITADGTRICRKPGSGEIETLNPKWIHMAGSERGADVGFFFPEQCRVHALCEPRQGSWKEINDAGSPEKLERFYQTLWFGHGEAPAGDTYAYVLLPGYSEEGTASFAEEPRVRILELNAQVHAVEDSELGITAAHFWKAGWYTSGMIACSSQASIVLQRNPAGWSLAIADPTQRQRSLIEIGIEFNHPVTRVMNKSDRITVEHSETGKVRLWFDPDGAGGASFHVELGT